MTGMEQMSNAVDPQALLITVAPTGAETTKADCPQLPDHPRGARADRAGVRGGGRGDDPRAHPRRRAPADPRPEPAHRHRRRRCARAPTWSSSSPPAARSTTRSRTGSRCSTRSRTPAASPWARPTSATTSSSTRGRSCASSTSSARSARWCLSSSSSTSARSRRCTGCSTATACPHGGSVHCDLVMGVPGGMPGTADALVAAVAALPRPGDQLVGDRHRPLDAAGRAGLAVSKGGHLRVGHGGRPDHPAGRSRSSTTRSSSSGRSSSARWPSAADDDDGGEAAAQPEFRSNGSCDLRGERSLGEPGSPVYLDLVYLDAPRKGQRICARARSRLQRSPVPG